MEGLLREVVLTGAEMGAGSRADLGTPGGWEAGTGPRSHRRAAHSAGMKLGGFGVDWEGSGGKSQGPDYEGFTESEVVETDG